MLTFISISIGPFCNIRSGIPSKVLITVKSRLAMPSHASKLAKILYYYVKTCVSEAFCVEATGQLHACYAAPS